MSETLSDEELARLEQRAGGEDVPGTCEWDNSRNVGWCYAHESSSAMLCDETIRRLVVEVRRLRALASCEACAAGMRLGDEGALHYDDARNGATWGVCRRVVARHEREELLRLRAAGAPPGRPQS